MAMKKRIRKSQSPKRGLGGRTRRREMLQMMEAKVPQGRRKERLASQHTRGLFIPTQQ